MTHNLRIRGLTIRRAMGVIHDVLEQIHVLLHVGLLRKLFDGLDEMVEVSAVLFQLLWVGLSLGILSALVRLGGSLRDSRSCAHVLLAYLFLCSCAH